MPEITGELSDAEMDRAIAWVAEHWKGRNQDCPISGPTDWILAPHYVQYVTGVLTRAGNISYPMIMLACKDCGYTIFFNATTIGLLPPVKTEAPERKG